MRPTRTLWFAFSLSCTGEVEPTTTIEVSPGLLVVQPELLNYGEQELRTSASLSLTLSNQGTGTLQIYDFEFVDEAQRAHWSVDSGLSGFLEPTQEISVMVTATPNSLDDPSTGILIRSDDPDRAEVMIPLQIDVFALPAIRVEPPESLDIGQVNIGDHGTADLIIGNSGYSNLNVSRVSVGESGNSPFSIDIDASGTIVRPRTDDGLIRIRFAPTETGTFNETVTIESDDPQYGTWTVTVYGTGL